MASGRKKLPDLFEDNNPFDPVGSATGPEAKPQTAEGLKAAAAEKNRPPAIEKKKAGFYLSVDILDRFNQRFHRLKLEGMAIENKSALLEAGLAFALDDLDKGKKSRILKALVG